MLENGPSRAVRSRAEWAAIIGEQERSGDSARSFCREQAICYKQFLYRRRTLKKSGLSLAKQPPFGVAMAGSFRAMSISGRFTPLQVEESASVRLRFPKGLILETDCVPSAAWVVEVAKRWAGGEGSPC